MYKKFLLAAAGILATNAALIADTEVNVGAKVGYRTSKFTSKTSATIDSSSTAILDINGHHIQPGNSGTKSLTAKGIKHLMLSLNIDALIDESFFIGFKGGYGFKMGKTKVAANDFGTPNSLKVKSGDVWEADLSFGYRFALNDSFAVMPVVGFETYDAKAVKHASYKNAKIKINSPYVGLRLIMNPSEDLSLSVGARYGFAKLKTGASLGAQELDATAIDIAGPNTTAVRHTIGSKSADLMKFDINMAYALDTENSIDVYAEYTNVSQKKKLKSSGVAGHTARSTNKLQSLEFGAGYTYSF